MSNKTKFGAAIEVITDMETNLEMTLKKKEALKNIIVGMGKILQKKDDVNFQEIFNLLIKLGDISEDPQELRVLLTLSKEYKDTNNEDINENLALIRSGLASLLVASMHKSQQNL